MGFGSVFCGPARALVLPRRGAAARRHGRPARRRAVIAAAPAALPPYHAQVAPLSAAQRKGDDARGLATRLSCRALRPAPRDPDLRRLRRARPPRSARGQSHGRGLGRAGVRCSSTWRASRSGACSRSRPTAAPTSARSRPTTPPRSTAAARRARRAGRSTPTAGRSTSIRSRTRTSRRRHHQSSRLAALSRSRACALPARRDRRGRGRLRAFARIGWGWGGRWSGPRDYQHLSASGR